MTTRALRAESIAREGPLVEGSAIAVEPFGGVSFGLALGDDDLVVGADRSAGMSFGLQAGSLVWFHENIGAYAQLGCQMHALFIDDDFNHEATLRMSQLRLGFGVAARFGVD